MFTVYAPFFTMTQIEHYRGGGGGGIINTHTLSLITYIAVDI